MKHSKCSAMLLLRVVTGALFIYYGWPKLFAASEGMAGFVGGAFHNIGLTFLSPEVWLMLVGIAEVGIGAMLILGLFVSWVAPILAIIMLGAMHTKGRWLEQEGLKGIMLDLVFFFNMLVITIGGAGKFALQKLFCKSEGCCGKESCKTDKSTCEKAK